MEIATQLNCQTKQRKRIKTSFRGTHCSMCEPPKRNVVVVGAGLAGLYAAKLLRPAFPDIVVLEANDKPGGRVQQARAAVELNCSSIR